MLWKSQTICWNHFLLRVSFRYNSGVSAHIPYYMPNQFSQALSHLSLSPPSLSFAMLILIQFPAVPYLAYIFFFEARRNFISYYGIFCAIICPGIEGQHSINFGCDHLPLPLPCYDGNPVTSDRACSPPQACNQTLMIQVKNATVRSGFQSRKSEKERERRAEKKSAKHGNSAISYARSALTSLMADDFAKF